jgi:hypothetical protein
VIIDHWPLFGLVLRTPRLELRLPGLDRLAELADPAAAGVHDPARDCAVLREAGTGSSP